MKLSILVGNGRKIGLLALPVIALGIALLLFSPRSLIIGGPHEALDIVSIIVLVPGIINWIWSVALILRDVPRKKLITHGPYAIAKHPLYNGVALLVLPWLGFLFNTWYGVLLGLTIFAGSKFFSKEEEEILERVFGDEWKEYEKKVLIPWL